VVWSTWPDGAEPAQQEPEPTPPSVSDTNAETEGPSTDQPKGDQSQANSEPETAPSLPVSPPATDESDALTCYRSGMDLYDGNEPVKARTQLSKAYYSGRLSPQQQRQARGKLTELAELTLIGRGSGVYADDPYTEYYQCRAGDVLAKIERARKLHVPWQLLVKVNNMRRPEDLEAGRRYKLVYGPFHAVVRKGEFVMDVYLHREGLPRVFVRQFRIGTGANGSTPAGMWRVRLGGKSERCTWYPPPNSRFRDPIPYGHPDYAFGGKGLWIALEGLDATTRPLTNYGIHSTNDPDSIGSAESLGCIRLADDDIELVYSLLYEHWSTVEVRP